MTSSLRLVLLFLLTAAVHLTASEFTRKSGELEAAFSARGGTISALRLAGQPLALPGTFSLADQLMAKNPENASQIITESFARHDFALTGQTPDSLTFRVRGSAAFDWLRLSKTYRLEPDRPVITITYTLENLDQTAHRAGIWTRTFFRHSSDVGLLENTFFQPRGDSVARIRHPGKQVKTDEWSTAPGYAWTAVGGHDLPSGVMIRLPRQLVSAYYSWFSFTISSSTVEWFLREIELPAGASRSLSLELECSADIGALVARHTTPEWRLSPPEGEEILYPKSANKEIPAVALVAPATGVMPTSSSFFDLRGPRQYTDAIQSALLPPGTDPARIALYPIRNGRSDLDNPLPFRCERQPDGILKILYRIPGVAPKGFYYTRFTNDEAFDTHAGNRLLGPDSYAFRLELDSTLSANWPDDLFAEGENLIDNGRFERRSPTADWPDAFFWSERAAPSRKNVFWIDSDLPQQGKCLLLKGTLEKFPRGAFETFVRVQAGARYTASMLAKSDNVPQTWASIVLDFYDAEGKLRPDDKIRLHTSRESFPWKKISQSFVVPNGAAICRFGASTTTPNEQLLYIDDVRLQADPITLIPKSRLDTLREQLLNSWYAPLEFLEQLSHATETPHHPWFKPSACQLPDILYLCQIGTTQEDTSKRQIIELCQRHDLTYTFIPVLRKIVKINGSFGIHTPVYAPEIEEYTLERIRTLPTTPRLAIVQRIDFDTQVQPAFVELLLGLRRQGCTFLFLDCLNVPAALRGKPTPLPAEFFLVPDMRTLTPRSDSRICQTYEDENGRTATFYMGDSWYYQTGLRQFRAVPEEQRQVTCPAYYSRDFPSWEYLYLPMLKTLRWLAGTTPAASFTGDSRAETAVIEASAAQTAELLVTYRALHREEMSRIALPLQLKAGRNDITLPQPTLPGGTFVAEMQLRQNDGQILDAAALKLTCPETTVIPPFAINAPDRCFPDDTPLTFSIALPESRPGDFLVCEIEDSNGRIVFRQRQPARAENPFSLTLLPPKTLLSRIFARLWRDDRLVAQRMEEISTPQTRLDPHEIYAYMWGGNHETGKMLRDVGFDFISVGWGQDHFRNGYLRNLANLNLRIGPIGSGHVLYRNSRDYRGDIKTDPVRNPCFSDPERQAAVTAAIAERVADQHYRYYDAKYHFLGDEQFLGSSVCFSPHCLRDFRASLRRQYGSLEALNRSWGSQFGDWQEVMPQQLDAIGDPDNLAPWLDHKMFMCGVFAHNWLGHIATALRTATPGAMAGLSGTQIPGYSYDWVQMMKHIDFLAYYSGVQVKLVHDFATPGFVSGQWGGGYVAIEKPREPYQKTGQWTNLFLGANLIPNWHGSAINGDLSQTPNLGYYTEQIRELKRGIGKLVLTTPLPEPQVVLLFSQPSFFTALGSFGANAWQFSQTAWCALLRDLKIDFRFITYEALEQAPPTARVLILPAAVALSDRQQQQIDAFAAAGGTVLADFAPGFYDEHGRKRPGQTTIALKAADLDLPANPAIGLPACQGRFQIGIADAPPMQSRNIGQGRFITMNIMTGGYQTITLGGVGGETATVETGAEIFCRNLRAMVGGMLQQAGVTGNCLVTDAAGNSVPCTTMLRSSGGNHLFGIINATSAGEYIPAAESGVPITIKLPVSGFIYDVRARKPVGQGDTITTTLAPDLPRLYAILEQPAAELQLQGKPEVRAGEPQTVSVRSGRGHQVIRLELYRPDGVRIPWYDRNLSCPDGQLETSFQIACNERDTAAHYPIVPLDGQLPPAPDGKWRLVAINVASGATAQLAFTITE